MTFDALDTENINEHFFRVEMFDVTNSDLLNVDEVRNYLSFVAPVAYDDKFPFRKKIYAHADALGFTITEYKIIVNDKSLSKEYEATFQTRMGTDKIFNVAFKDFYDADGNLIAWSWIGLSTFKGVINPTKKNPNRMRYIRLRQKNIQIGDEKVFQNQNRNLFSEDRGVTYFIGEVHAVDPNLRPNSRRDYFEENDAYKTLEDALKKYFAELTELYRHASNVRSAFNATERPQIFLAEIERHTPEYQDTHIAEHEAELAALESAAAEKQRLIDKQRKESQNNPAAISSQVFEKIAEQFDASDIEDDNPQPTVYRVRIGRMTKYGCTIRFTKLFLQTRNWRAVSSLRNSGSFSNEPPRPVNRAELEEQISAAKPHETCNILSERLRGRCEIFQGRLENFRRATFAGGILFRGSRHPKSVRAAQK